MEVHHHSHSKRKKWIDHLWEFLMLFLAVFCGFLAENEREHYVEHQREKQYIRSLISDVKTDTANIRRWGRWFNGIKKRCDTILNNFDSLSKSFPVKVGRNYIFVIGGFPDFIYTDRTIQQLKNSGGMRLIRKAAATDSIIAYDAAVRDILVEETGISLYFDQLNDLTNKMLSYRKLESAFNIKTDGEIRNEKTTFWIKQDTEQFEHLYNLIYKYRQTVDIYNFYLAELKDRGGRLVGFLQKEYNMK